ncbi:MAG: histidine phosphatase family protein [Bacteroidetes bacterium]|nr:histidine phosphatase family protein [Bacteroidota bacterium]HCI72821.1 histidine phosphatase family protein [Balneola sp.]|tara:strand:+ start:5153 stop:5662 length:510 start_codon:yes stop_codon:yes gene_type:complete
MKQILLLRHAKSSWDHPGLDDFDRPLAKRGLKDAPRMGKFLRKIGRTPDLVISSTAQRARETSQLAVEGMKEDESIITWNSDLYYGSVRDYLKAIQSADGDVERVMIVGHNPKMEDTAGALIGPDRSSGIRMPTAALVCVNSYAASWDQVQWGGCELEWMMIPKVLKEI